MSLLNPSGAIIKSIQSSTKKEYDPKEVQREQQRLHTIYANLFEEFKAALVVPEDQPDVVAPDITALRKHYGDKWAEQAKVTNDSSLPVRELDVDGLYKLIDQYLRHRDVQANLLKPLHQLDLDTMDMSLVGHRDDGTLWINSHVALCITDHGAVRVYLRPADTDLDVWCSHWMEAGYWPLTVEAINYTMAEVHALLKAKRVELITKLTEAQLAMCRQDHTEEDHTWTIGAKAQTVVNVLLIVGLVVSLVMAIAQ